MVRFVLQNYLVTLQTSGKATHHKLPRDVNSRRRLVIAFIVSQLKVDHLLSPIHGIQN